MINRTAVTLKEPRTVVALGYGSVALFGAMIAVMSPALAGNIDSDLSTRSNRNQWFAELMHALPVPARWAVIFAFGLLALLIGLLETTRATGALGAVATKVETGQMTLWRAGSLHRRAAAHLRVMQGETLVLSCPVLESGTFGQGRKRVLRMTVGDKVLDVNLGAEPGQCSALGLVRAADAIGVGVRFDGDAKYLAGAPRAASPYDSL